MGLSLIYYVLFSGKLMTTIYTILPVQLSQFCDTI
jgi:hypothetical protein